MTQVTITLNEKLDLEEGTLEFFPAIYDKETEDLDMSLGWDYESYFNDNGTMEINNSGNVTIITSDFKCQPYYLGNIIMADYIQIGYFVDGNLVKSTQFIPIKELEENHTNTPINISDVEVLLFALGSTGNGVWSAEYDENDKPIKMGIPLDINHITELVGYDSFSDYDLSQIWMKITNTDNETETMGRLSDFEHDDNMYYLDPNIFDYSAIWDDGEDSFTYQFINPNIVTNKGFVYTDS